jgi:hypothetical protein
MFSVIIPTMWVPHEFEDSLKNLIPHPLVDEIIIIDNESQSNPNWDILNSPKIKLLKQSHNINVNASWNLGKQNAKNDLLCFLNDDILFDVNVFNFLIDKLNDVGIIGIDFDSKTKDFSITEVFERTFGFGCLFFMNKENYFDIPEELLMFYGDDYLFEMNRKSGRANMVVGVETNGIYGKTSSTGKVPLTKKIENEVLEFRKLMSSKRILFFIETKWAYGSIYFNLCKELHKFGIQADILDWSVGYSKEYLKNTIDLYDNLSTTPYDAFTFMTYDVPVEKLIITAHGEIDLYRAFEKDKTIFDKVKEFTVVSENLFETCKKIGIKRVPKLTTVGVNANNFYQKVPSQLENIGYAASISAPNYFGTDIKRGHLVQKICDITGTQFCHPGYSHFYGMPLFYSTVDCVITSSLEETVGLPMLEASCAGRLVMTTNVGYSSAHKQAITLPFEEDKFIEKAVENINYYKNNIKEMQKRCNETQQYAMNNFCWSKNIESWLGLF